MSEAMDVRETSNYDQHNPFLGDLLEVAQRICSQPETIPSAMFGGVLEMNLFIDCEFNSMGGQLLSIALVPEDLQFESFYRERAFCEPINPWVLLHVVPKMQNQDCTLPQIQAELALYLNQYDKIHLIADWPDDIKYFCELLITGPGTRLDTPPLTMEIRRDLDAESSNPHHALADAIAIRDKYLSITP